MPDKSAQKESFFNNRPQRALDHWFLNLGTVALLIRIWKLKIILWQSLSYRRKMSSRIPSSTCWLEYRRIFRSPVIENLQKVFPYT